MYGPIRDIIADTLGYPKADIDIDITGEGGRPDVTVRAPSGIQKYGKPYMIDWIVVEAKDEPKAFLAPLERERIFAVKSKYVTLNTAWFLMVEPQAIVARPVQRALSGGANQNLDVVYRLDGTETEATFRATFALLAAQYAGVPERLAQFRKGDNSSIATDKLALPPQPTVRDASMLAINRRNFFSAVAETTALLQSACKSILDAKAPAIKVFEDRRDAFSARFHGWHFEWDPLVLRGEPRSLEESQAHVKEVAAFRRAIHADPAAARLALVSLPDFEQRTGSLKKYLSDRFATEAANLILARIMVVRFLEDHGFFGARKYVCNGGVEAFQQMRAYFEVGYTRLLEDAFRSASRLYAAAFEETELDWVIHVDDANLSAVIEWSMYIFSRFDFSTIRGDTLTGIYDRFLDRSKRKEFGEFYTPPAVARYIVDRLGIDADSKVLDPACGSGTFLLEAYDAMVGKDIARGAADWDDVQSVLERINGNDLNPFSSILAQIQMMWQLLSFRSSISKTGFPEIRVSEGDALKRNGLDAPLSLYTEIESDRYDAIIGNPPYIRPERLKAELGIHSRQYFEVGNGAFEGISSSQNSYALFLYKALDAWCVNSGMPDAGRVGFIVPLSLFDSDATADLRRLFQPGGRFKIEEIVDLEMIYDYVFDAWTYPMIVIARSCPASATDNVSIKLADPSCIVIDQNGETSIDFSTMPAFTSTYSDIFAPDGRILTRLTSDRATTIRKLQAHQTINDVILKFWVKTEKGNKISAWTTTRPAGVDAHDWSERSMLRYGLEERNSTPAADGTPPLDVYKGENVISGAITGEPAYRGVGPGTFDNESIWRYRGVAGDANKPNILGTHAFAVPRITHTVNAAPFNPQVTGFLNTVGIFVPDPSLGGFPFDLLFLSGVFTFYYALAVRRGIIRAQSSTIYPSSVGDMPWTAVLSQRQDEIESLRKPITDACNAYLQTAVTLSNDLEALGLRELKQVIKARKDARLQFSNSFDDPDFIVEVNVVGPDPTKDGFRVSVDGTLMNWLEVSDEDVANGLVRAMLVKRGEELKHGDILRLPIPADAAECKRWDETLARFDLATSKQNFTGMLHKLDLIVAECFGLTAAELQAIWDDLSTDPFLSKVKPLYPGSERRIWGLLSGLDQSTRYR